MTRINLYVVAGLYVPPDSCKFVAEVRYAGSELGYPTYVRCTPACRTSARNLLIAPSTQPQHFLIPDS